MLRCCCRLRVSILTADTSPDKLYHRECSRKWTGCKKKHTDILGGKHTDNDIPIQSQHYLQERDDTSYETKVWVKFLTAGDAHYSTKFGLIIRHYFFSACFWTSQSWRWKLNLWWDWDVKSDVNGACSLNGALWSCKMQEKVTFWHEPEFKHHLSAITLKFEVKHFINKVIVQSKWQLQMFKNTL